MIHEFDCTRCGQHKTRTDADGCGTGYATSPTGDKICYACMAEVDKQLMRDDGRICLYWNGREVTNWPGTLRITPTGHKTNRRGHACFGGPQTRVDVWFTFDGRAWHGVLRGDNTQIIRCRRLAR